ncbi:RimK/LysX family protein [Marinobacter sp. BGYM27]|uniref:ATP-dependent zinc protease family protein n=1 Tax=unclassified Marinobacter TaxID=83889 RepID=UPI0021A5B3EB|nr:RimK/LysX family protein [Marinobacter sp. BGYM27]MDG5498532.1 RimK/LysX family protein [Marinobacter sp. BGYM27]
MLTRATRSPFRFSLIGLLCAAAAGCSTGSLLVDEKDLGSIETQQQEQSTEIRNLSEDLKAHHRGMVRNNNENTRALIDTIRDQIKTPACPEKPQPVCSAPQPANTKASQRLQGMLIVGERENVHFLELGYTYEARIDSGAETSSLDARNVKKFERDGDNWVRFDVPIPGADGKLKTVERPVARRVRIIQSSQEGDSDGESRAVVEMQFAIGDHIQKAEFTLTDRQNLTYTALVGRNILRDVMLVDVGKTFATELPDKIKKSDKAESNKKKDESDKKKDDK